ncbi:MAG: methyltransferase domain-containing protein, partial [Hyphomicrobiales bacterium]|nr:methyltransferase domain-containing protein [Hyphomicrobiales bacterium]
RLLVIGVGTGLELPLIGAHARVEGIDISEPMLKIARARVARAGLSHVRDLRTMDAQALALPDETFDAALAPYVLSVVPDPGRALDEAFRTLKPGGEIVTVNHFAAERGPRAAVEAGLEGAASFLGWHPNFPFAPVARWLAANPRARLVERREVAPFRLFTMLRIAKTA